MRTRFADLEGGDGGPARLSRGIATLPALDRELSGC
jgi:hypothetical protein